MLCIFFRSLFETCRSQSFLRHPSVLRDHGSAPEQFCPLWAVFFQRSAISHTATLPSPRHRCSPREKQRPVQISTSVVTGVDGTKLNITSNCRGDSGFEFVFKLPFFLVWLSTMATEPRLLYYLSIDGCFEFKIILPPRPLATHQFCPVIYPQLDVSTRPTNINVSGSAICLHIWADTGIICGPTLNLVAMILSSSSIF